MMLFKCFFFTHLLTLSQGGSCTNEWARVLVFRPIKGIKVPVIFDKILQHAFNQLTEDICSIQVNLYQSVRGCEKDFIHSGCRLERAHESLAGLFVYTDAYLCFSLCLPAQLVANGFTLERIQACLPLMTVCSTVDLDCEKVYTVSSRLMSSFGTAEH